MHRANKYRIAPSCNISFKNSLQDLFSKLQAAGGDMLT